MTKNDEVLVKTINELSTKISQLEAMNSASIEGLKHLAKSLDKLRDDNKQDHLAIQILAIGSRK